MTSLIRDQMSFTTRMKSMIPNRLPFRHPSKATDISEFMSAEHIKTEHGHGVTPSSTVNVVLFGETGVGKSSVINLIARKDVAKVSSDVNGCTMQSTQYDIEFDNMKFSIFDTIGLEEPQMGVNGYLKAIEKAYELVTKLSRAGGVHLLLFCMRGGRITATTQSNYRLFCEILCSTKVPIALVFTGLEREAEMEEWWKRNKTHIEGYGIKSDGHACITAVQDDTPGEDLKYTESQKTIRELLKKCALRNTAYSPDTLRWFARLGRDMMSLIEKRVSPKRKKVLKVLVKRCKLDPETAKKIADMMEKGDSDTQPAPPGIVAEVNPPDPEAPADPGEEAKDRNEGMVSNPDSGGESSDEEGDDSRRSDNEMVVVPQPSATSFPGRTAEAGQQAQGGTEEEKSRSNAESNAAGRQKTKHANEYVTTPNPDDADRAGTPGVPVREAATSNPDSAARATPPATRRNTKQLREEPIPDSATRTISSRSVGEGARQSREEPDPGASSAVSFPGVGEGIRQSKEELNLHGAGRAIPSLNAREGIRQSKEELYSDNVPNATPYTGIGQTAVQPRRVPSPGSAGKTWSAVPTGESPGQAKKVYNPDSGVKAWSATSPREGGGQFSRGSNPEIASKSHVGTGGSTGQPRNASSVVQPPNAIVAAQTYAGRGDSTRQSSSHRSRPTG